MMEIVLDLEVEGEVDNDRVVAVKRRIDPDNCLRPELGRAIIDAVSKDGTTPEKLFQTLLSKPLFRLDERPTSHQFFMAVTALLEAGLLRTYVRHTEANPW